jgi:RimJ/RimL family protein N-acetyltransferase
MKYRNAAEMLPPQLLQELQKYIQGKTLYVPKIKRKSWGESTGAKALYSLRNAYIRNQFSRGKSLDKLSGEHFISEDAVKKIVYKKGEIIMNTDEINYSKYFWQNDLVRVRRSKPDDWKYHQTPNYDSEERFFSDYEQELPKDENLTKEIWESYVNANQNSDDHILLAFETHSGEYVGGGNLHGINERNGTFGMFVGAIEERYALAGAQLMLNYAFNERRLNNCHTGFIENDTIYKHIFEKLGFKLEGVRRQQVFHDGKYWDEHLYGLLAEEFNEQYKRTK